MCECVSEVQVCGWVMCVSMSVCEWENSFGAGSLFEPGIHVFLARLGASKSQSAILGLIIFFFLMFSPHSLYSIACCGCRHAMLHFC